MIRKGVLPEFFRNSESDYAAAVRLMHDMQYRLLSHFNEQAEFLRDMTDIGELVQERVYSLYPATILYPDTLVWSRFSTLQKEILSANFLVVDPVTRACSKPGIVSVERISAGMTGKEFVLASGFDYTAGAGVITFSYPLETEKWDRVPLSVAINGRQTPVAVPALPVLLEQAVFMEDWYYKRAGILLGLDEFTSPYMVTALYRLVTDGDTSHNIDALLAAYSLYGVSLHRDDRVVSVTADSVITERETYPVPYYSAETVNVFPGTVLEVGQRLFEGSFLLDSTRFPEWVSDRTFLNMLSEYDSGFETRLRALISDNAALVWGKSLPVRITDGEESIGLWVTAPVVSLPAVRFRAGDDAYPVSTAESNMVLYSAWDRPTDLPGIALNYSAGSLQLTLGAETVTVSVDGLFTFSNGLSGRILDVESAASWTGGLTQSRSVITVDACDEDTVTVSFGSTVFKQDMIPEKGDWIWFSTDDAVWSKVKIHTLNYDDDMNLLSADCLMYGKTPVAAGTYTAVIFASYDGDPHTGVDSVRIDAFGELLRLVSRHIELLVINGGAYTEAGVTDILTRFRDRMNIWKAFIIVNTDNTDDFIELRRRINEYI